MRCLQFDRERIPERVVHARGATAKGFFEVNPAWLAVLVLLVLAAGGPTMGEEGGGGVGRGPFLSYLNMLCTIC